MCVLFEGTLSGWFKGNLKGTPRSTYFLQVQIPMLTPTLFGEFPTKGTFLPPPPPPQSATCPNSLATQNQGSYGKLLRTHRHATSRVSVFGGLNKIYILYMYCLHSCIYIYICHVHDPGSESTRSTRNRHLFSTRTTTHIGHVPTELRSVAPYRLPNHQLAYATRGPQVLVLVSIFPGQSIPSPR